MLQECILPGDLEAVMEKSGRNLGALGKDNADVYMMKMYG
jgi:hypothetical protein